MIIVVVESLYEVFDGLFDMECKLFPIEWDIANSIDRILKDPFIFMVLSNAFVDAAHNLIFLKLLESFRIVFRKVTN
jgi:hypothetical protein